MNSIKYEEPLTFDEVKDVFQELETQKRNSSVDYFPDAEASNTNKLHVEAKKKLMGMESSCIDESKGKDSSI